MRLQTSLSVLALATVSLAQGTTHIPVTGVPVAAGAAVPLRQNINDLVNSGPQWDLYVQAMYNMSKLDSHDPYSYFQIAGIHGAPYIEYNKAGAKSGDGWLGYCPHGEDLFISWHRPYVLLFEQALVSIAKKIADGYPAAVRAKYQAAAASLRAPYWDWALDSEVPPCTVPQTLKINIPSGSGTKAVDYTNPLRTYYFPHISMTGSYGEFTGGGDDHTVRCVASKQSYPATANSNLAARPYKSWIYDVLTNSQNFADFASTSGPGINFEQIHNAIHWDGACGNQFLAPDYSGFDPLFFMHHAQVDRMWALWEAIMPQSPLFTASYKGQSRFNSKSGSTITPDSPLQPFYQANGKFHTSNTVKSIVGMGYSYKGIEYWQKSQAQIKSSVTTMINQLYGPNSGKKRNAARDFLTDLVSDLTKTRYFAKVSVNVTEITTRPCEINVYVGGQKAGSLIVMKLPAEGMVNGGFTIDNPMESILHGGLRNAVQAFSEDIEVEILTRDGQAIPLETVPSLSIDLETANVTLPSALDQLPKYGQRSRHRAKAAQRGQRFSLPSL
ncbi:Di-copper centre-containing protein [Trichoderma citrinoviride]|uniref:tyrosinase n=1 Tax=Trichoderma citrinoviride TaxID=58853 RepID=A0A2T4BCJ5_9HYPO|nr:Di-copper centre-containing protein [Trichoderma citrinoviride]PTB66919.1 Di-copper centre-containing protein [Trichoderma citrinoviride]